MLSLIAMFVCVLLVLAVVGLIVALIINSQHGQGVSNAREDFISGHREDDSSG